MKLHRVELAGFGPFLQRQVVDFDAFDRDGIFLITGRTGAGKSSVLDGVCFALYGSVPRYETGDRRLRSDHCTPDDPTEVRLEFTVGGTRWRVTRAPEYQRPAKRGGGLTTEPTRAELEEHVDGAWIGRAARPRDVGLLLDEVLGLNAAQFQQVILLAQNRFSRFLLASGAERQGLLRAVFGTRRYEEYAKELGEAGNAAQRELDALGERARTLLDQAERLIEAHELDAPAAGEGAAGSGVEGGAWVESGAGAGVEADAGAPSALAARRDVVERAHERAAYRVDTLAREASEADAARSVAETEHAARVVIAKSQRDLLRARQLWTALESRASEIAETRRRLVRAREAEGLRAHLDATRRADRAATESTAAAVAARDSWIAALTDAAAATGAIEGLTGDAGLTALTSLGDELTGELAMLVAAASEEAALPRDEKKAAAAAARIAGLEADLAALETQRTKVPAELQRLQARIDEARELAARLESARARESELTERLRAARQAETLAAALRIAEISHRDAALAAAAAGAAVAQLLQRRLAGHAGELAATLVEGEPCAVCGATEHPAPAASADQPVTDDMLAAAESARDDAIARERDASGAAASARMRHAEAAARAGGDGVYAIEEQLHDEAARRAEAEEATTRRDALLADQEQLTVLAAAAETARTELAEALAGERRAAGAFDADLERRRSEVAAARGAYDSVAARATAVERLRDAARTCVDAEAAAARDERARATALEIQETHLVGSAFADAADATAALLAPSAIADLDDRISAHDAQVTATKGRMLELELELAGIADEPVDLAASQAALDRADAARTVALTAARDARHVADSLRDLAVQIDAASAGAEARAADAAAILRLADTVAGRAPNTMKMDLETFVLAAELEEIVTAANVRLGDMSSGRYRLQHSDARAARGAVSGLGLEVVDAHTGRARPAQSLSGGETFLASLALALGLAEVVTARAGGIRLDTLFIDEGFGSLDDDTLDLAMRTLDELRQGGRTVGVISHVASMKEQLPAQVSVESTPHGPSLIRQDAARLA